MIAVGTDILKFERVEEVVQRCEKQMGDWSSAAVLDERAALTKVLKEASDAGVPAVRLSRRRRRRCCCCCCSAMLLLLKLWRACVCVWACVQAV